LLAAAVALAFLAIGAVAWAPAPRAAEPRYLVAFANLTEEPGVALEGTGFTGGDVRESFLLAVRDLPIDLVFYDNQRDASKAVANAIDAIDRKVNLYIQYHQDLAANLEVAEKLRTAGIPVLAVNYPVPGAPLYTADNLAAGRIAGDTLGAFASRNWPGQPLLGVLVGALADQTSRTPERAQGVAEGLKRHLPTLRPLNLDTHGNPTQVAPLLGKAIAAHPSAKIVVAAMDDATALAAKGALEAAGRAQDAAIVSHGVDRSIHGGVSERKEIDPYNRGSIVIGSVAFYLDRYGYDILPLALRMLRGEPVPPRITTRHQLITAANVWREYPPRDMN
jgi:ribose transport system substrate-binding protein